jgi:hypothetical protein
MKLTNTLPVCKVKIGSLYTPPAAAMSEESKALQRALLPPGQPWEESAPAVWKQVFLGALIVGAFLAACWAL